jgi:hypothetical protein
MQQALITRSASLCSSRARFSNFASLQLVEDLKVCITELLFHIGNCSTAEHQATLRETSPFSRRLCYLLEILFANGLSL